MSYCRWSSDDFQCDVYCYEADEGFIIHVAVSRPVLKDGDLPPRIPFTRENIDAFMERWQKVSDWLKTAEKHVIGLPFDGETYVEPTAQEAADRLLTLKAAGYNVPQGAIDSLLEDVLEDAEGKRNEDAHGDDSVGA